MQRVGEQSLQHSITLNNGLGGAFVAMNPQNGSIYAMGSNPSFNPTMFTHQISQKELNHLQSPGANAPLYNRATQSVAPDGSTFKAITSVAALQSGTWTTGETYDDTGQFCPAGRASLRASTTPATSPTGCSTSATRSRCPTTCSSTTSAICS